MDYWFAALLRLVAGNKPFIYSQQSRRTRGKLLWKSSYTSSKIPKNLWKNPKILLNPRTQEISKNCIKYLEKPNKILKIIAILRNPIKFKHLNRELAWKCPLLILILRFKNNSTDYMSQKMSKGKIFRKNQLKKSQNPEKNCRDFLIPKILVRFFQSNLPLVDACGVSSTWQRPV
jgi:hypothetical protein